MPCIQSEGLMMQGLSSSFAKQSKGFAWFCQLVQKNPCDCQLGDVGLTSSNLLLDAKQEMTKSLGLQFS